MPHLDDLFCNLKGILEANYHLEILKREESISNEADSETNTQISLDAESEDESTRNLPRHPLSFYDRHVASNLTLKNVKYLPSITHSLSKICDKAIEELSQKTYVLSSNFPFFLRIPEIHARDAFSVREYYYDNVGEIAHAVATKLLIHFRHKSWDSAFDLRLDQHDKDFSVGLVLDFLHDDETGHNLQQIIYEHLPDDVKETFLSLSDKYPSLGAWHFFPMADVVAKMFGTFTKSSPFHWETSRTSGRKNKSCSPLPPDASIGNITPASRTTKPGSSTTSKDEIQTRVAKHILPVSTPRSYMRSLAGFGPYIQRAWRDAVIHDATFLVLNCGRYERIGFRHRGTQTLYISGLIDPAHAERPHYRQLHVGLYTAIIQDALSRQEATTVPGKSSRKRSAEHLDDGYEQVTKRLKRVVESLSDYQRINEEISKRKLALVELRYDIYCSPVPSSFLRVVEGESYFQRRHRKHEYFLLTLGEVFGSGSIGNVHLADLEVILESGEILHRSNLAMKLAFSEDQRRKLRNEYNIYCHLSKHNVQGLVQIHGLFEDAESKTLGMLMDHCGDNLRIRQHRLGKRLRGDRVHTTDAEKEMFQKILQSIHDAGVLHGDIRPENMLVGPEHKLFIIDFDRARFTEDVARVEDELETERGTLYELIDP